MNWRRLVDPIFPVLEPHDAAKAAVIRAKLDADLKAIRTAKWSSHEERALDEAQRIGQAEADRVNKSEAKATTYLAALAALVPLVLTIEAANWEKKSGPAPEWARLVLLTIATIYIAAAAFHAFRTLGVVGFQRIGEAELTAAWRSRYPLRRLTRETLVATRLSRETVNSKVTGVLLARAHLVRAFAAFVLLLLLDPFFYALGSRGTAQGAVEKQAPIIRQRTSSNDPNCRAGSEANKAVNIGTTLCRASTSSASSGPPPRKERK
jgi:hypothetical protein